MRAEAGKDNVILATDEQAVEILGCARNVYTHTELADQTAAIAALPGSPAGEMRTSMS